jgi:ArsR family transcriptional regulator, virulence genes transcriptional regulator
MPFDLHDFETRAAEVADVLKALGNPRRLMVLCLLATRGPTPVGELAIAVGLSQSALSQHLARMRDEGLVAFDRKAQVLRYRIADARIARLLDVLYGLYCPPDPEGHI